jgi:hypothetical protein
MNNFSLIDKIKGIFLPRYKLVNEHIIYLVETG